MAKFLKYHGKGVWMPIAQSKIQKGDKIMEIIETKPAKEVEKEMKIATEILASIETSGHRSIKLSTLLTKFGFERKSAKRIDTINSFLNNYGFYAMPILTSDLDTSANIQIYNFPVEQLGDLFDTELELENFIYEKKLFKKLGISDVDRQYSPSGTKDRLDFRGTDKEKNNIVLELKNKGGGKSAVEQVLRYAGQLKKEEPKRQVRTILVTGIRSYETALAISGMRNEQRKDFEWFLYNYNNKTKNLDFVEVTDEEINKALNSR